MKVELLSKSAINSHLHEYWRVLVFDELASTQSEIKKINPSEWDLVAVEFQSAGRGRLDRKFEAEKYSALLFSFFIKPTRDRKYWGFIPLIAGAATANSINKLSNLEVRCKWPNDLTIETKKIGGILTESFEDGVIIGIGLNVSMEKSQLPIQNATSIYLESGQIVDRNLLLSDICNEFKKVYSKWDKGLDLIDYYTKNCATIGENIKAIQPNRELIGKAIGVSESGALLLADGGEVTVGDLVHLRD